MERLLTDEQISDLLNEAYDLGVDSVLRNHFDIPWDEASDMRKNIDRLRELARADREGRLIILDVDKADKDGYADAAVRKALQLGLGNAVSRQDIAGAVEGLYRKIAEAAPGGIADAR